jgi:hypothetical protein
MLHRMMERRDIGGIVIVTLVGAAVAVKFLLGSPSGVPAPAVAAQAPVHLSGSRIMNTAPFSLESGGYTVAWSATPSADNGGIGCYHAANLKPTSGGYGESLVAQSIGGPGEPTSGTTHLYGVGAGSYYVSAISGCGSWTFDLSQ